LCREQLQDVGHRVDMQQHSLDPDEHGIVGQFLCAHPRWVFSTHVLEAYNGWIFGGRLQFYPEEIAEKIPMGFNSKESFTKMDENSNVADRVGVEVMELKPVEIKKAMKERASGKSQTPFKEMVE
jgi:hypothetical protein